MHSMPLAAKLTTARAKNAAHVKPFSSLRISEYAKRLRSSTTECT